MEALLAALAAGLGLCALGAVGVWWLGRVSRMLDDFGRRGEED